ncbi:uncharacterized protein LOC108028218 isoform X1 [Drosophila biarmipes]|uniref:uncharacterized protein LOC108028218 isoform X1 n=2 Tax=Drosophila biarmipes TaxID=125945 RepID=UPI0007E70292|nr:uncharacterized protein LOC108028218 isoform X1 [Drosophila biarmipes]
MCLCPPIVFKIALLLSIGTNIALTSMEMYNNSDSKQVILTVNLVACFIALLFLALGVYGAIMNHIVIIKMLMVVLVVFCLFKIVMWIVCANLSPALSDAIIHIWFMVNTAASIVCTVFVVIFWMRLHELTREFQLGY